MIINAAIVVFRRHGFHVATTHDIAAEAGLSQSNLYNYIKSKDDVLFLVCDHLVTLYIEAVDDAVGKNVDPYARLTGALRSIIAVMSQHRDEVQLLYHETHSLKKKDRTVILALIAKLIDRFELLVRDYEAAYGSLGLRSTRVAANLLSFVPAVMALRSWDLSQHCNGGEAENAVYEFLVAGLALKSGRPRSAS